ncbi:hypothetical protein QFZ68_007227 [Streptomyces sp. V1I6]|nr:hypothetical protein [Streptomyces sp. V1I6]
MQHLFAALDLSKDKLYGHKPVKKRTQFREFCRLALFASFGSGSAFVPSDAPLWLDIEESDGRWGRGKYGAKAGEYGPPLLPVLRVDPV